MQQARLFLDEESCLFVFKMSIIDVTFFAFNMLYYVSDYDICNLAIHRGREPSVVQTNSGMNRQITARDRVYIRESARNR